MKETVNVNIGSQAFTLDEDAYRVLRSYLDDIRSRLPEYDTETMNDIESRIAEIFRESITSPMLVVSLDTVRTTMTRMGSPADFGERCNSSARQETTCEEEPEQPTRKLYRSRTDRSIAGICGGLADFFHTDATVLRLIMLFLILFGGLSIWAYIILWIIIPEEPAHKFNINNKKR
ncbi:PspC domain-containing protein [uncultured Alistipes sp.]|jgi:putative stress-responsive transcriptional regulator|uniref:PspC domain-containing protein n=1 Tax=uncultured Alistipes sp. TaxID=538949 RepID=UPI0025FF63D1|nr:PspC domain-containing protein [uncultured Alistipes sp.]